MVRTVAWYLLWALIVLLIVIWLLGGGIAKIKAVVGNYTNPIGALGSNLYGGGAVQLPWAVPIPQGPDISNLVNSGSQISQAPSQSQTFGNQSPYGTTVTINAAGAKASNLQQEYLLIQNNGQTTLTISGWSIQSVQTGQRAYIPLGAESFGLGQLNPQTSIAIVPGGVAVISSGESPVGTSFRENECTGYLNQLQPYSPPINAQCPAPAGDAPRASQYGPSCASYVASLPSCTFPRSLPQGLSAQCGAFVQNTFSYNGCVAEHQGDPGFASNAWRVYLNAGRELWNNDHDTIRLLDAQGQIVAVTSY